MANYPGADPSFTSKNTGDSIQASHINSLQDEVVAIGSGLRATLQHSVASVGTVTAATGLVASSGGLTVSTGNTVLGQNLSVAGTSTFTGSVTFSSLVSMPAQPRCLVFSSVALALPSGAWTEIAFESEEFDVGSLHSTGTNPGRITIPAGSSGLWLVGATVRFSTGGAGAPIFARILKNSTTENSACATGELSSVAGITLTLCTPLVLDGGDYISVECLPSGSTASIGVASVRRATTDFWAKREMS